MLAKDTITLYNPDMAKRIKQINLRVSDEEYQTIITRASDEKMKVTEFLRDLLLYGILGTLSPRR